MFVGRLVALLALFAVACAQQKCTTETYGSTNGQKVHLKDVIMTPGVSNWDLSIPSNACTLLNLYQVGLTVTACDNDSPPDVVLSGLLDGSVYRTGNANDYGAIKSSVYCAHSRYGSSDKRDVAQKVQVQAPRVSPVQNSAPGYMSRI